MDAQNIHFSMLKYILNYCFQSSKVGKNGEFYNCMKLLFTQLFIKKIIFTFKKEITVTCGAFYLPPGSPEGDYNLHHVRVYVRACVRACVTQFSLKLLQLHIFGKSQVLMNFVALQYFWGLVNFGLLLSE